MAETSLHKQITTKPFGLLPDGREVNVFELVNSRGIRILILNYGGILQSVMTPDREGVLKDIVLGFDTLQEYVADDSYHGALVGRFANRIADGKFELNGEEYQLLKNEGENCLHGGPLGFNRALWDAQIITDDIETLRLTHTSPHGDQGFPGEVRITADYRLSDDNELSIEMRATTDRSTFVSLTMHPYFNLTGNPSQSILDHALTLHADQYLPISDTLMTKGYFADVEDSPFDFRNGLDLGANIYCGDEQLQLASGFDHCFVQREKGAAPKYMAELFDRFSGRELSVKSNAPGLQLYTGNFLTSETVGKGNKSFSQMGGVCLEPEEFPNAPNEPRFALTPLHPGEVYKHNLGFKFSVRSENV